MVPMPQLPGDDPFWGLMQKVWTGQKARGHIPRGAEDVEAERRAVRDEWESGCPGSAASSRKPSTAGRGPDRMMAYLDSNSSSTRRSEPGSRDRRSSNRLAALRWAGDEIAPPATSPAPNAWFTLVATGDAALVADDQVFFGAAFFRLACPDRRRLRACARGSGRLRTSSTTVPDCLRLAGAQGRCTARRGSSSGGDVDVAGVPRFASRPQRSTAAA